MKKQDKPSNEEIAKTCFNEIDAILKRHKCTIVVSFEQTVILGVPAITYRTVVTTIDGNGSH